MSGYQTILYKNRGQVATITLNRPERLNTIVPPMPAELEGAVHEAVNDERVKVIVIRGAGRSFCAGYDFSGGFEHWPWMNTDGNGTPARISSGRQCRPVSAPQFMSVWRAPKPVIAQVHGWCVGGGSDFALCADIVIASEDARIGTPIRDVGRLPVRYVALPPRPDQGQVARAHRQAAQWRRGGRGGPDQQSGALLELEKTVADTAEELCSIPASQLAAQKLIINQAYENMGLASTQTLGPILDGLMRNTPDAERFIETAASEGVGAVVSERDGPFGDYSQAPADEQPDPSNVIEP